MFGCFFGHKWTKWVTVWRNLGYYPRLSDGRVGELIKYSRRFQTRECKKCGYIEEELLGKMEDDL